MKKILFIIFLLISEILHAEEVDSSVDTLLPTVDDVLDYKIGGGDTWRYRLKKPDIQVTTPGVNWNIGGNCSGWDAGISVEGLMNDLDSQFNRLQKDVYNGIKSYVLSLPSLLLQRLDPALYETVSSGMIQAEDIFDVKAKTCREMSERFSESSDFGTMADTSFWVDFSQQTEAANEPGASDEDKDLVKTIDEAEESKGEQGVVGADGEMCGGANQEMCKPVEDIVKNAYDLIDNGSGSSPYTSSWIYQIWGSEASAVNWIQEVVGDVKFALCKECEKMIETPGIGVYQDIAYETDNIIQKLQNLVQSTGVPSEALLKSVSSNSFHINSSIIFALREESSTSSSSIFISRIAEEVALMKVVDKLLAARRLMIIGISDAKVSATEMNIKIMDKKIEMVNEEISIIKQELELKMAARGDTIVTLLNRRDNRRARGFGNSFNSNVQREIEKATEKFGGKS